MSEGKKFDNGKSPVVQGCFRYFPRALLAVAVVSDYGRGKYNIPFEDRNFLRVEDAANRYNDALGRHQLYEVIDGPWDKESQLLHAAHEAWNALARLEVILNDGADLVAPPGYGEPEDDGIPF